MRRILALAAIAAIAVAGSSIPAGAASGTCGNSFPADGHAGPWHTMVSGGNGTLHGNAVHVSCPTSDTHWSLDYSVQFLSNGTWTDIFQTHHQGNGSPFDFSDSVTPFPCSDGRAAFPLRTHVHNLITGGSMNKPGGGGFVHICGN